MTIMNDDEDDGAHDDDDDDDVGEVGGWGDEDVSSDATTAG